jgi:hypothetical protein
MTPSAGADPFPRRLIVIEEFTTYTARHYGTVVRVASSAAGFVVERADGVGEVFVPAHEAAQGRRDAVRLRQTSLAAAMAARNRVHRYVAGFPYWAIHRVRKQGESQ